MSKAAPVSQAAVRESQKVLEEKTQIPDGPNVAPSPLEHLAAQGVLPEPEDLKSGSSSTRTAGPSGAPGTADTAGTPDTKLPPAESSAGDELVEAISPAEQGLVEEQLAHDSAAARQTSPPSSAPKPGDASDS